MTCCHLFVPSRVLVRLVGAGGGKAWGSMRHPAPQVRSVIKPRISYGTSVQLVYGSCPLPPPFLPFFPPLPSSLSYYGKLHTHAEVDRVQEWPAWIFHPTENPHFDQWLIPQLARTDHHPRLLEGVLICYVRLICLLMRELPEFLIENSCSFSSNGPTI